MTNKLVSIIINCHNGGQYLKEAINSVYSQSYSNWEIIFWDNCSTDDSKIIAKSYDRKLKYFLAEEHTLLGKARNLALEKAGGEYVCFLDCDDKYLPDKIEIQLAAMQENNAILSFSGWVKTDDKGNDLKICRVNRYIGNMFESLLLKYIVNFQTVMVDNKYLKKNAISFDEELKFSPDHNLVLRIAYKEPVMSLNFILAKYRTHSNSLSATRRQDKYSDLEHTLNFFENSGVATSLKNFRSIALQVKLKMLINDYMNDGDYKRLFFVLMEYILVRIKFLFNSFLIIRNI
jgi:glycosyltransferase involved in cell wall biosynthesis